MAVAEIEEAALPWLTNAWEDDRPVPPSISNLAVFNGDGLNNVFALPLEKDGVAFLTGGAMGYWGIAVCTHTNRVELEKAFKGEAIHWTNRVFFLIDDEAD